MGSYLIFHFLQTLWILVIIAIFADALLGKVYRNVWVLDISANVIKRSKKRLGSKALIVFWVISDVTEFEPLVQFDFWHDRQHFFSFTTKDRIYKYVSQNQHV